MIFQMPLILSDGTATRAMSGAGYPGMTPTICILRITKARAVFQEKLIKEKHGLKRLQERSGLSQSVIPDSSLSVKRSLEERGVASGLFN